MDPIQDFKSLQDTIQKSLVATTRTVNSLANEDLQFQRTANPSVGNQLEEKSERLLQFASKLLKSAGKVTNQPVSTLEDNDDVEIQWKGIVDVIDSLLEKADTCLDEYTGLIKRKDAPAPDSARLAKRTKPSSDRLEWSLKRANILKPQNAFEKKVDNHDSGPWKPLLTEKPHATVSLEDSLVTYTEQEYNTVQYANPFIQPGDGLRQGAAGDVEISRAKKAAPNGKLKKKWWTMTNSPNRYKHPYEAEIRNMQYPQQVYEKRDPRLYFPVESTTATWVDTYEGVLEMLEELKQAKEIALDLEHHDYRSYTGLLSLMQISTREKDWIVDTLVPWRHKLQVLNEVFADPSILKVLHGAFMDIIWLQRDLGLYVVGLFDTHHASVVLGYPGRSLAFLLKKFVDFDADKKYQLADWRIRPLPEEMFYYARSDTHYLLYIFDMVRNELVEKSDRQKPEFDYIEQVVQKSKEVSLLTYENPYANPENGLGPRGWYGALSKVATLFDGEQFSVYKAVHQWRDQLARREDESPVFFMSQQVLADIARVLPSDKKALWSLLDSNARGLKVYLDDLFDVIQAAKAAGINGPTMGEVLRASYGEPPMNNVTAKATPSAASLDLEAIDIQDLKSQRSQLWGDVAMSSTWEDKGAKLNDRVEIIVPYPFVHDAADSEPLAEQKPAEPVDQAAEAQTAAVGNEEFTLRSGRKRKLEEVNVESEDEDDDPSGPADHSDTHMAVDSPEAGGDSSDDDDEDSKAKKEKADRKAERKARKKEKKRALQETRAVEKAAKKERKAAERLEKQQQQEAEVEAEEEEEAFDYSKAEPVLNAKSGGASRGGRENRRGKAVFNPYGKGTGDAPKSARATNHIKNGGRSATFKK